MTTETKATELIVTIVLSIIAIALLVAAIFVATPANAQTVPGSISLSWQLPTEGCVVGTDPPVCGPLTEGDALTAINVYLSTDPIADDSDMAATIVLNGSATTTQHTMTVPNGATVYARVRAVNAAGASDFSEQRSRLIRLPLVPGVPTNVTIDIQVSIGP